MNREQSLELVRNEKATMVACVVIDTIITGSAVALTPMAPELLKDYSLGSIPAEITGVVFGAMGTVLGAMAGKAIVDQLSFYNALSRHLKKYSSSYIVGEAEDFRNSAGIYCNQYVKDRRNLRRQRVKNYKDKAILKLEVLE